MKTIAIILSSWLLLILTCNAALPVVDVAAITSQRIAAQRDYLEQVLHGLEQAEQTLKLIEEIKRLDTMLERHGDPAAIRDLEGIDQLYQQLKEVPVLRIPELKREDLQADEVFRPLDANLYRKLEKEITLDGEAVANRDGKVYHPEVAERRSQDDYRKIRASVLTRRQEIRQAIAATMRQLQQAGTSSEVQKLSAVLTGLQTELQSVDNEMEFAASDVQARTLANATEREIFRKAAVETERVSLRVGTRKDAETYKLFTTPIRFSELP